MLNLIFLILAAAIFSCTSPASAAAKPADKPAVTKTAETKTSQLQLTEFDLARNLVDTLGFSEGLPAKPVEKDYLQILTHLMQSWQQKSSLQQHSY